MTDKARTSPETAKLLAGLSRVLRVMESARHPRNGNIMSIWEDDVKDIKAVEDYLSGLAQTPDLQDDLRANALILLAAEDERQAKLHELLETIREQIRLEVPREHRPETLFQNIQDAVYAMRGRTLLLKDAAITAALAQGPDTSTDRTSMDARGAAAAAEAICDYADNNLSMFEACCEEDPVKARELYEAAKRLRDLFAGPVSSPVQTKGES